MNTDTMNANLTPPVQSEDLPPAAAKRERPILFSGPMVRALLAGTKTQTRRAINPASGLLVYLQERYGERYQSVSRQGQPTVTTITPGRPHTELVVPHCPYGQPGDRLWVREAWRATLGFASMPQSFYRWRASDPLADEYKWKPSIHMPRVASRITLEVTDVRVERLQDISEADANADGCDLIAADQEWSQCRRWYEALWNQINGPGSWDANPWVWAVSFRALPSERPRS